MIQRYGTPGIALAGLDADIRLLKGCRKEFSLGHSPMGLVAIGRTHVVQITVHQFALIAPRTTPLDIVHHACAIAVVHRAEHAECGELTGSLRGEAFLYEFFFLSQCSFTNKIRVFLFFSRGHLNRLCNQLQAGIGNVAQLATDLYQHIDTGAPQILGRHQPKGADTSLTVAFRFHAQHP